MTTVTGALRFKDLTDALVEKAAMHYKVVAWDCLISEFSFKSSKPVNSGSSCSPPHNAPLRFCRTTKTLSAKTLENIFSDPNQIKPALKENKAFVFRMFVPLHLVERISLRRLPPDG